MKMPESPPNHGSFWKFSESWSTFQEMKRSEKVDCKPHSLLILRRTPGARRGRWYRVCPEGVMRCGQHKGKWGSVRLAYSNIRIFSLSVNARTINNHPNSLSRTRLHQNYQPITNTLPRTGQARPPHLTLPKNGYSRDLRCQRTITQRLPGLLEAGGPAVRVRASHHTSAQRDSAQ